MTQTKTKKWLTRIFVLGVLSYIGYEFYRWPSAAAETGFMLLCESDYAAKTGVDRYRVQYASATTGRFGKWQVALVLEHIPDTPPARKVYCSYDRTGLVHLQDVRSGFVYNRDDAK